MATPNTSSPDPQPDPSPVPPPPPPEESAAAEVKPATGRRGRPALTPESLVLLASRLDLILAAVVLVFAFLLASFAARNSDLWMDLAAGRLIAQGQYTFGADPFAFTTPQAGWTWINHAWLYDWLVYQIAEAAGGVETPAGGAVLVAIKAVLTTALAAVMLWIGRRGGGLWVPAVVVALALLVMSPWLLLQPVCLSLLFLALTLAILHWPRAGATTAEEPPPSARTLAGLPRHLLLLPLLFVLWVNLDDWFLLGLVTVGLYLLGEWLQLAMTRGFPGPDAPRPRDLRALATVLVIGLVACLLNPYHVHAFTLPRDLWALFSAGEVRRLPSFRDALSSPFADAYVKEVWAAKSPAGFAYYGLLLLGVLSFNANWAGLRVSRLLLWVGFALLSIVLAGTMPFFAVVGGVLTALNFQEWAGRRFGTSPRVEGRWKVWTLGGRALSLAAGLALLALAWPGWLDPYPDDPRRTHHVAWAVEADPSYRQAARKLAELREHNVLGAADHGFNFTPEFADYCAWFCPGEKGFLDHRLPLFAGVSGPFLKIRRSLAPEPGRAEQASPAWQEEFRNPDHPIDHVILSGSTGVTPDLPRRRELFTAMFRLWDDPAQWTMLYGDGRTFIFGWNDPHRPAAAAFRGYTIDFNALAFGPDLPPADRAPSQGPEVPAPRTLWDLYVQGPAPYPLERDTALMYQQLFSHVNRWPGVFLPLRRLAADAEPAGLAPAGGGLASLALAAVGRVRPLDLALVEDRLLRGQNPDPAALLLLAVRASRRAIAASPGDAPSYGRLGLIYRSLQLDFESPMTSGRLARLRDLRQIQSVTAFQRALRFQPDNPDYHHFLADEFRQMNLPDLTVFHLEKSLEAIRAAGPKAGETPADFEKKIQAMEKNKAEVEKQFRLPERKKKLDEVPANAPPLQKAQVAAQLGLMKAALDILRAIDPTSLNEQEKFVLVTLEGKLLILTGQGSESLEAEQIPDPWDKVLLAAANGDYARADQYLEQILVANEQSPRESAPAHLLRRLQGLTFQGRLDRDVWTGLAGGAQAPVEWVDLAVLRGLLALEAGDTAQAARQFRHARTLSFHPLKVAALVAPLAASNPLEENLIWPVAARHLQERFPFSAQPLIFRYLQLLEAAERHP